MTSFVRPMIRRLRSFLREWAGIDVVRVPRSIARAPEVATLVQGGWNVTSDFRQRRYASYESYVDHQKSKLSTLNLSEYDERFRRALSQRLVELQTVRRGDSVLCLAARVGSECKAFIDVGCFAVGIDLNPGPENHYVVHGDFHRLQFADQSIDYVFTNSLDHAYDLDRILTEVSRVLKPSGALIAEIILGTKDEQGREPGAYESLWWDNADAVIEHVARHGFRPEKRGTFSFPWNGVQVVFHREEARR